MHPAKYDARERPVRVRVGAPAGAAAGRAAGDFGEFDTEQLLRAANGEERAARAAAGWGGGGFALWRRPGAARTACRVRWVWDSAPRRARVRRGVAARCAGRLGGATVSQRRSGGRAPVLPLPEAARALDRAVER